MIYIYIYIYTHTLEGPGGGGGDAPGGDPGGAGATAEAVRDFKDTIFTSLRIILSFFEKFLVEEDLCFCFFELGTLNSIFNQ